MNKLAVTIVAILIALTAGCGKESEQDNKTQRPYTHLEAVATTGMIGDLISNVGSDLVGVRTLIGPGIDPHSYVADADGLNLMADADVIFCNGLGLEASMSEQLIRLGESVRVVELSEAFDVATLIKAEVHGGECDPHVWFDIRLWMLAVEHVANVLTEMDPNYGDVYFYNSDVYLEKLAELHEFAYNEVQNLPAARRVLITAHDAFRYFGRTYGFRVQSLTPTDTAEGASDTQIQDLVKFINANRVPVIFSETSIPSDGIMSLKKSLVAGGIEVQIAGPLYSDAMGEAGRTQGTYVGMIQHNIRTIVTALRGVREGALP